MNAVVMHEEPGSTQRPAETGMTTTPSQLLTMAVQQGADLDRLERLMELQQKWESNEARKQFAAALAAFKSEALELMKTRQVRFTTHDGDVTSYRHAELAVAASIAGAALAKHALSFRWDVHQDGGRVTVDCILMHSAGHSERVTMSAAPDASGKKNAIQQVASTVTYLERYTLLAITGMAAKDTDDDGITAVGSTDSIDPAWSQSILDASDTATLKKVKVDMVANWKGATNIPKELVSDYNLRFDALREAAKHE